MTLAAARGVRYAWLTMGTEETVVRPVALVTGASAGIGAAFARELARRGYDLVLVARRRARLEEVAAEAKALGADCEILEADLTDEEDLGRVAARAASSAARAPIELLINNAGHLTRGPFHERDANDEAALVRVHALAPLVLTHAAVGSMIERGSGAVIQVASRAAFVPYGGFPTYAAVKAFLHRHALGIAPDLEREGVRVLSVCPGNTRTELFVNAGFPAGEVARMAAIEPEKVAVAALQALDRGARVCVPDERLSEKVLRRLLPRSLAAKLGAILTRMSESG